MPLVEILSKLDEAGTFLLQCGIPTLQGGEHVNEDFHNLFVWVAAGYNEDEYLDQICRY